MGPCHHGSDWLSYLKTARVASPQKHLVDRAPQLFPEEDFAGFVDEKNLEDSLKHLGTPLCRTSSGGSDPSDRSRWVGATMCEVRT